MKTHASFLPPAVPALVACLLAGTCLGADSLIGVNFAGGNANGAPTLLDPADEAGVVPQVEWNNTSAYSVTNALLKDNTHQVTAITLTYSTSEMWGSGAFNAAEGLTNGNAKLLNGYLNSLGDRTVGTTNTVTFSGLDAAAKYAVVAYTLRDQSGEQAAYWINDAADMAFHILSEGGPDWVASPQFRQALNTDPLGAPDLGNCVRWDNVSPRANGSLSVNVASEFYRGPINGIQLISAAPFPATTMKVAILLQPQSRRVLANQSAVFNVIANGPWDFQWYSNNVAIPGATSDAFTTAPLVDQAGTLVDYKVVVSHGADQVTSDTVRLILMPPLPTGGIFYDGFPYAPGPLRNAGDWTLLNIAQITSPGLTYSDGMNSLEVSGNAMVPPMDWDPFPNIPVKLFGTNLYGGANSTNFMSFLFDFRNLNPTNHAGYIGVSAFEGANDWGNERFFVGKTWYGDFITVDGRIDGSLAAIPYLTNGFIVLRVTQDDTTATYDLFFNPPLAALPEVPTASGTGNLVTFNAVGVNAGEWHGEKGKWDVPFTEPGPIVDEFRFGQTYASVAPIAAPTPPSLTVELAGNSVRVAWSPATAGFTLQMSDSLSSASWGAAPGGNPVTIPADRATRYFRLIK